MDKKNITNQNHYFKINESIRTKEIKFCFLCKEEGYLLYKDLRDRLFTAPGVWSLMKCSKCNLVWLNPQPVENDIGKLYSGYYTHSIPHNSSKKSSSLRKDLKNIILKDKLEYPVGVGNNFFLYLLSKIDLLQEIVTAGVRYLKFSERGKLLDVGCGNGYFLAQMRDLGWKVVGVEPDAQAVKIAKEYFGLEVFQGTLKEVKFPSNTFDAITINHVIEHVLDPIDLLAECRRILKPGGKLVVITPNINSLGRHIFGKYWRGWEVPRHVYLFSPKSLRITVERAGLVIQQVESITRSSPFIWMASCLIKKNGKLNGCSIQKPNFLLRLGAVLFWIIEYFFNKIRKVGEEIVVIATK